MRQTATAERPAATALGVSRRSAAGWMRSMRVSWFTVLMILVVVLFVIIIAPGFRVFLDQRQQLNELRSEVSAAEAQNAALQSQVARWDDPAYVRAQARERLYYVMPGETSLLVLDDVPPPTGPAATTDPTSATIQTTRTDWLSSLFSSGMTAGLSTSTPDQLQKDGRLPADPAPTAPATPGDTPAGQ